jgi:hypothetical protein
MQRARKIASLAGPRVRWLLPTIIAILAIGISVALVPAGLADDEHDYGHRQREELGPGCAPDRPAVAHQSPITAASSVNHSQEWERRRG